MAGIGETTMIAPVISSIIDLKSGTTVRITLDNPVDAVSFIVLYQDLTSQGWTEKAEALATAIDIVMPSSRFYAFIVVAVDVSGNYSLPSNKINCLPTSGSGSVQRQIEKNIIATLETITTTNGYFDTVNDVTRIEYRVDAELEGDFFLLVAFDDVTEDFAAHYGLDVIDSKVTSVIVAACHKGRTTDDSWIADTGDDMLTAVQAAIFEDRSRGSLALDTDPQGDTLRPEELKRMADAVAVKNFNVIYRTLRTDTHANAIC